MRSSDLLERAMGFATLMHGGQRRKYTTEPYTAHLAEVAGYMTTCASRYDIEAEHILAVCWLHDVLEDTAATEALVMRDFGYYVARGVVMLTDTEVGNRKQRQAAKCARLSLAAPAIQSVKVADLLSNSHSIIQHDPDFAVVYVKEALNLLDAMQQADRFLVYMLRLQLSTFLRKPT
jgi:guanosine-3',5'-bis(diphosphate) 3'-pyrophosphohydrolase